jgi:glutathione S-transferase
MTYELYWISGSPYAWSAMLAMELKGLTYESQRLDPSKGEHKTPEYLAMNPHGKVPTLKDNESNTVVYETTAILAYLESKHPESPLFGTNPIEAGHIWQRISEITSYAYDPIYSGINRPLFYGRVDTEAKAIQAAASQVHENLKWVNGLLSHTDYLAGKTLSAADVLYMPIIQGLLRATAREDAQSLNLGVLPFDKTYPKIFAWLKRMETLPTYGKAYPPHWRT